MENRKYSIGIIGAGNVASHLVPALYAVGHKVEQIISRTALSAEVLAQGIGAEYSDNISKLKPDLDIVFLTVPDHALIELVNEFADFRGIVVHTSGSVSINIFSHLHCSYGIFYPLQTFSKKREIDFKSIPVFIEASDNITLSVLSQVSGGVSDKVYELGSEQRAQLHLAAVFVNNFTNYLLTVAYDILGSVGLEKEVMVDLLKETLEKSIEDGSFISQTGPAVRGDISTIKKHLNLLSFSPELSQIYQCLTESIQSRYRLGSEGK